MLYRFCCPACGRGNQYDSKAKEIKKIFCHNCPTILEVTVEKFSDYSTQVYRLSDCATPSKIPTAKPLELTVYEEKQAEITA